MKDRYLDVSSDADRKQTALFDKWLSAENIPFTNADAMAAYRERVTLIKDAIQLKKTPARIPICPSAGFFPVQYAGVSMYDAMYHYDILTQAWEILSRLHPGCIQRPHNHCSRQAVGHSGFQTLQMARTRRIQTAGIPVCGKGRQAV